MHALIQDAEADGDIESDLALLLHLIRRYCLKVSGLQSARFALNLALVSTLRLLLLVAAGLRRDSILRCHCPRASQGIWCPPHELDEGVICCPPLSIRTPKARLSLHNP